MTIIGGKIIFIGNSYTTGSGASDLTRRYSTLVANAVGSVEDNRGDSGATAKEIMGVILGQYPNNNYTWRSNDHVGTKLVVIYPGLNTVRRHGNHYIEAYKHQVRALVACAHGLKMDCQGSRYSYVGTSWVLESEILASGGKVYSSMSSSGEYSIQFNGDEITVVSLVGGGRTVQLEYSIDGVVQRTVDYTDFAYTQTTDGNNDGATGEATSPIAERFTGAGSGSHTLTVKRVGGSGKMYADCAFEARSTGAPRVLVVQDCELDDWSNTPPRNNGSDAAVAAHNAAAASVAGEFGADVRTVGPPSAWDKTAHLVSDKVHPNNVGHNVIANNIVQAINAWGFEEMEMAYGGLIASDVASGGASSSTEVMIASIAQTTKPGTRIIDLVAAGLVEGSGSRARIEVEIDGVAPIIGLVGYYDGGSGEGRETISLGRRFEFPGNAALVVRLKISKLSGSNPVSLNPGVLEVFDLGPAD